MPMHTSSENIPPIIFDKDPLTDNQCIREIDLQAKHSFQLQI